MRYPSKSLALSAPRPGMVPPQQRAEKSAVVSPLLLRSDAVGAASGPGIRRLARVLSQ